MECKAERSDRQGGGQAQAGKSPQRAARERHGVSHHTTAAAAPPPTALLVAHALPRAPQRYDPNTPSPRPTRREPLTSPFSSPLSTSTTLSPPNHLSNLGLGCLLSATSLPTSCRVFANLLPSSPLPPSVDQAFLQFPAFVFPFFGLARWRWAFGDGDLGSGVNGGV